MGRVWSAPLLLLEVVEGLQVAVYLPILEVEDHLYLETVALPLVICC